MIFDALSSLAGVVALFLAVKAYKVAQDSYQVAREQGRKTFELEVLRDLAGTLRKPDGPFQDAEASVLMSLIPEEELPEWRQAHLDYTLDNCGSGERVMLAANTLIKLYHEVLRAIEKRV